MKNSKSVKTKAQRRLAVVQDAIEQVKLDIYLTGYGGYLQLPRDLEQLQTTEPDRGAKGVLCKLSPKTPCKVCAKGALLLSLVRKENEFNLASLQDNHLTVLKRLIRGALFTAKNLFLVEAYYEGWSVVIFFGIVVADLPSGLTLTEYKEKHNAKVIEYREKFGNNKKEKLLFILANMAGNKGIFKP